MLKPGMEAAHSLFRERNESILLRRMSPIVFDKGENNGRERKDRTALDDEQLQNVTGGVFSFLGRGSRATMSKINILQNDATMASKGAATTKNPVFAQRMNAKAAQQMEEINNLNAKVRGF